MLMLWLPVLRQPIWDAIVDFDPQVFVWLGDNIYGDNKRPFRVLGKERTIGPWKNVPRFFPSTEQEMRRRYQLAKSNPGYSKLRQTAQVDSSHPAASFAGSNSFFLLDLSIFHSKEFPP